MAPFPAAMAWTACSASRRVETFTTCRPAGTAPRTSAQFDAGDPRVVPRSIEAHGDDVVATVAQQVRDLGGDMVVPPRTVVHRYSFDADDLVVEMRVEPAGG